LNGLLSDDEPKILLEEDLIPTALEGSLAIAVWQTLIVVV